MDARIIDDRYPMPFGRSMSLWFSIWRLFVTRTGVGFLDHSDLLLGELAVSSQSRRPLARATEPRMIHSFLETLSDRIPFLRWRFPIDDIRKIVEAIFCLDQFSQDRLSPAQVNKNKGLLIVHFDFIKDIKQDRHSRGFTNERVD